MTIPFQYRGQPTKYVKPQHERHRASRATHTPHTSGSTEARTCTDVLPSLRNNTTNAQNALLPATPNSARGYSSSSTFMLERDTRTMTVAMYLRVWMGVRYKGRIPRRPRSSNTTCSCRTRRRGRGRGRRCTGMDNVPKRREVNHIIRVCI